MEVLVNLYHSEVDHKDFFLLRRHIDYMYVQYYIETIYDYKHYATCVIFQICFYFRKRFLLLSVGYFI